MDLQTTLGSRGKAPKERKRRRICNVCGRPSGSSICSVCVDRIRAEAIARKKREDKGVE